MLPLWNLIYSSENPILISLNDLPRFITFIKKILLIRANETFRLTFKAYDQINKSINPIKRIEYVIFKFFLNIDF